MDRLSFTNAQIENVVVDEGWSLTNPPSIIPTRRGSVALLNTEHSEFVLKYADLTNQATEAGISPSRSAGIRNEAETLSLLTDDIAPTLYALRDRSGYVYSLSEYINGDRLSEVTVSRFVDSSNIISGLIRAVTKLNEATILHGDIHPDNVLLSDSHSIVLLDFELAHSIHEPPLAPGLVHYLSPEAAKKEINGEQFTYDQAEETFALAATILSVLTRSLPPRYQTLEIPSRLVALQKIADGVGYNKESVDKSNTDLAESLIQILESPASKRPNSPADLHSEIERFL